MRWGGIAFEDANAWDRLACLVLRVIARFSPCTMESLISFISSANSALTQRCATSASHERELLSIALRKLESCALIQVAESQIVITEKGRQFLDGRPSVCLQPIRPRAALLGRHFAWVAQFLTRLKPWSCFTEPRATTQRAVETGIPRAWDLVRKTLGKVAPLIGLCATALVHRATDLALGCRTRAVAWLLWNRRSRSVSWPMTVLGELQGSHAVGSSRRRVLAGCSRYHRIPVSRGSRQLRLTRDCGRRASYTCKRHRPAERQIFSQAR